MRSSLIMFDELNDGDVSELTKICTKRHLAPRQVMVECGQVGQGVSVILLGQCGVETSDGTALGTLQSGDIVGEVSFVDQRTTVARVVALSQVAIAVIQESDLRELVRKDTGFAARFYLGVARTLAYRLRLNLQLSLKKKTDVFASSREFANQVDLDDLDALSAAGKRLAHFLQRLQ